MTTSSAHGAALDATVQTGPPAPADLRAGADTAATRVARLEEKLAKFQGHVADIEAALDQARAEHDTAVRQLEATL